MTRSLCESCAKMREVRTARSRFLLCELSRTDADFPKYPTQPVVRCDGYQLQGETKPDAPGDLPLSLLADTLTLPITSRTDRR
jgi:hypothetical protein